MPEISREAFLFGHVAGYSPWLVVLLPLSGALINLLFGRFLPRILVSFVACGTVLGAFLVGLDLFGQLQAVSKPIESPLSSLIPSYGDSWISIPGAKGFKVGMDLYVDRLSCVMLLVVTGVGFLIHLYSTGYMAEEKRYSRYFGYLNLFTAFMLLLVLARNLLLMFVGWEGVGLCSYLLIGFWFDDKHKGLDNARAGMKAFVVNRVGDLSFTIGLLLLFTYLGVSKGVWTVDIQEIKQLIAGMAGENVLNGLLVTWVCICLFGGATGKSAQIPLYTWLPDAMAGPTPVSALIHAATMVTAGVYMLSRMSFLYDTSHAAMTLVATIGAGTALFAATIGVCQNDIKKVLAYSTVSQLGFMFLACGVGAYVAAIFHLMTHAFFKACLFLGSGSVIMGCHHEQDIRKMGGLRKYMPITFITFFISTLAIAGIPPFAGFFSKDEILWKTFTSERMVFGKSYAYVLYAVGIVSAFFTAFYMFRLVFKTFFGKYAGGHSEHEHGSEPAHTPHESPWNVTVPLVVLALLAIVGGFVGVPHVLGSVVGESNTGLFEHFLEPSFGSHIEHSGGAAEHKASHELMLMGLSVAIALAGIVTAVMLYIKRPWVPANVAGRAPNLYTTVLNKYYVDELYHAVFIRGTHAASDVCAKFDYKVVDRSVDLSGVSTATTSHYTGYFDNEVVDGAVNGVSNSVWAAGRSLRRAQTGNIKSYVGLAVIGALFVIAFFCTYLLRDKILSLFGK